MTLTFCEPQGVLKASVKLPRALLNDVTSKVLPEILVTPKLLGAPALSHSTVPLGLTAKATVPPLCFENDNGLGLVVTVTVHGVAAGLADGDADGDADGEADGDADGEHR